MMRRLQYLLLLVACVAMTVRATGDKTLKFVKTDGSSVAFSTSGLVITYDDYAHAAVANDETSVIIDLVDVEYMCFVEGETLTGDVNGDGEINIADVNIIIGIALGGTADDSVMARADVNSDGEINIADINAVIALILGH